VVCDSKAGGISILEVVDYFLGWILLAFEVRKKGKTIRVFCWTGGHISKEMLPKNPQSLLHSL